MSRRVIEIYLDIEGSRFIDSDGALVSTNMVMFRGTEALVQCHLRLADGLTYFEPPAGSTWFFAIDDSFTEGHDDYVVSNDSLFNISGDWSDLDVANGKISFRVDTATTQLTTAMGTSSSKEMYGELWMTPPAVDPIILAQWKIDMKGIVSEIGDDTTLSYYSAEALRFDGDDVVLYYPDGSVAQRWSP